ncbi:MAG TPA: aspartate-semialdehyde dehydrogenase [Thermoanaerobaculia bacterium]|nr:aspartate-semialdehyde dehydrogenase [Thermoanaerobaculia bacterium]
MDSSASPSLPDRTPVAVLGATGMVGQRLVERLARHPWFALTEVVGSDRSAGRSYAEAAEWLVSPDPPPEAVSLPVLPAGSALRSRLVFSALSSAAAAELEPEYAGRGHLVVSNASRFRMHPDVPLLVPEINPDAVELLSRQQWAAAGGGIVCNPNCVVTGLALALAPLHRTFGVEAVLVTTFQALSGAGYPGVPSLAATANVVPFIAGEEEKIESEPLKILDADFPISAAAHRVPVVDGHLAAVSVRLRDRASLAAVSEALTGFRGEPQDRRLPTAPERPLEVLTAADAPQPRRDVERGGGMTVSIGRLRADPVLDLRFVLLVHNTVRGAAGAALLNAELLAARGLLRNPTPLPTAEATP